MFISLTKPALELTFNDYYLLAIMMSPPTCHPLITSNERAPEITDPHVLIRNKLMSISQDPNEEIILSEPILVSLAGICPESETFIMQSITPDDVFN